jgi:HEAT repeat protein
MSDKTLTMLLSLVITASAAAAEERILVQLSVDQHSRSLCSITVSDVEKDRLSYMKERPGDDVVEVLNRFTKRLADLKVCGKVGSELRVSGTATLTNTDRWGSSRTTVAAEGKERLCFRRTAKGWAYLCGRGGITRIDSFRFLSLEREPQRLGWDRTVDSCVSALGSGDAIVREGCARDLPRLASDSDRVRLLPRLSALLSDPIAEVRRGAAEALAVLGDPQSVSAIQTARAAERDELTKEYFGEALALLAATAFLRENRDAGIPAGDAAQLYMAGRDTWVDDVLARPSRAQEAAASILKEHLSAGDPKVRLAVVWLLRAMRFPWAHEALAEVAEKDSNALVKAGAKSALERIRDGK